MIDSPRQLSWAPTLGAVPAERGARFSVWAPDASSVDLVLEHDGRTETHALARDAAGVFSGCQPDLAAGARYRFSFLDTWPRSGSPRSS